MNNQMQKLGLYLFLLFIMSVDVHAETIFDSCRIKGYSHTVDCLLVNTDSLEDLQVYRVTSAVRYPLPEPVIWIPNGLAFDSSKAASRVIRQLYRVLSNRDMYWLGLSDSQQYPNLRCPDKSNLMAKQSIAERIDPFNDDEQLYQCQQHLLDKGIRQFSAESIAKEYEAARQTLGLEQVVVFAEGRGVAVAAAWHQIAPGKIKFQVFDSPTFERSDQLLVHPNQMRLIYQNLVLRCDKDSQCRSRYPINDHTINRLFDRLPQTTKVVDPLYGSEKEITLTPSLFYLGLIQIMSSPFTTARLPKVLVASLNNDWQPFIGLLSLSWSKQSTEPNSAASLAQYCMAQSNDIGLGLGNDWLSKAHRALNRKRCGMLTSQVNPIQNNSASTISNPVPTLILEGEQRLNAQLSDALLANKTTLSVASVSSNLLSYGCAKDVVYRYFGLIQQKNLKTVGVNDLDADCLLEIPLPTLDTFD